MPDEWGLERDPSLDAVRAALRRRIGDESVPIDPAEIARLLGLGRAKIAGLGHMGRRAGTLS